LSVTSRYKQRGVAETLPHMTDEINKRIVHMASMEEKIEA
jgi:hypothetical protein